MSLSLTFSKLFSVYADIAPNFAQNLYLVKKAQKLNCVTVFPTMNEYKDNPQLALATLEKIAEEIPSGVSAADVGETVANVEHCPGEIADNLRKCIAAELQKTLNDVWAANGVSEKLEMLKQFKCSETADVRSPLSSEQTLSVASAKHLRLMKEQLQARIKKIKEENSILEKDIRTKTALVQQQMKDTEYDFEVFQDK
ncbi:hypothetical protein MTP99_000468 [Tenebrio molitor]|jgi:hypothetical protein|nr:hypothetical protein MTP99_000468 [Tenebrio molitor]